MREFTTTQAANKARRSIKTSFVITGSELDDGHGHTTMAVLEITTIHSKERKAYYSSAVRMRTHNDGLFTVGSYDLFEGAPVAKCSIPVARYSEKAMAQAQEAYMLMIDPKMGVLLDWAAEKGV